MANALYRGLHALEVRPDVCVLYSSTRRRCESALLALKCRPEGGAGAWGECPQRWPACVRYKPGPCGGNVVHVEFVVALSVVHANRVTA